MKSNLWVLFIMDEVTAEPKPIRVRPFTRFEMRRMQAHVEILERYGVPARFDPVSAEEVDKWTSP